MEKSHTNNTKDIDPPKKRATESLSKNSRVRACRLWDPPKRHLDFDADEWKRQHDEVSISLRRTMITLLVYCFFCMLTLAAPDVTLIAKDAKINVPFAGTEVSYQAFLIIGPLTMFALAIYLHILLGYWLSLGKHKDTFGLPYVFNIDHKGAKRLANFIFYWLPCLVLAYFSWKTLPRPIESILLTIQTAIFFTCMVILRIRRNPDYKNIFKIKALYLFVWSLGVCLLILLHIGPYQRRLDLFRADLSKKDLRGTYLVKANLIEADLRDADLLKADLRKANLLNANLAGAHLLVTNLGETGFGGATLVGAELGGAYLRKADLQGAFLMGADLRGANFQSADLRHANFWSADLRGAKELTIEQLCKAHTLFGATLSQGIETLIKQECPELFEKPKGYIPDEKK